MLLMRLTCAATLGLALGACGASGPNPGTPPGSPPPGDAAYVQIEPGTFIYGASEIDAWRLPGDGPREVRIDTSFLMKRTEVTEGEWFALMGTRPALRGDEPPCDTCPVQDVAWWEAIAWCNAASRRDGLEACYELKGCVGTPGDRTEPRFVCEDVVAKGLACKGYRLPTNEEWEYAARAGAGGDFDRFETTAWTLAQGTVYTPHPVAQLAPNAWGLYDMIGNVSEWVDNLDPYRAPSPVGDADSDRRDTRGCGIWSEAAECRFAKRLTLGRYRTYSTLGFRPARTIR